MKWLCAEFAKLSLNDVEEVEEMEVGDMEVEEVEVEEVVVEEAVVEEKEGVHIPKCTLRAPIFTPKGMTKSL